MPSFLVHALVPPLVFLALGFDRRRVAWLWPLTILPDLDHFVGVPRASLHNLLVLLPTAVLWVLAARDPRYEQRREWGLLATAYLGSHLVMDMFNGGWTPLFPFTDRTVLVTLLVLVRQPEHTYRVVFEPETQAGPPVLSEEYLFLSPFEVAMTVFVVGSFAAAGAARWIRRRRAGAG